MKAGCLQILGVETCIHSLTLYVVEHRVRHYCGDDLSGGQRTWSPVSTLVWSTNRLTGSRHSVATSIALPDWTASQRSILLTLARTHTRRERERERERESTTGQTDIEDSGVVRTVIDDQRRSSRDG